MGFRITTNVASINAQRNLTNSQYALQNSMARLASGSRINKAADDAAGLAISENLRALIRGLRQANRNANDGISLVQTAEGGLNEIGNILVRFRELAIQASSDTVGDRERHFLDAEYQQLKQELQRIAEVTRFNGRDLLNGTGGIFTVQVGIHNDDFKDRISYNASAADATLEALGLTMLEIGTKEGAQRSLTNVDDAQLSVNAMRANFGALQNRLQSTVNNLGVSEENLSAANSRVRDTDVAAESSEIVRHNILLQAGVSVLSQANAVHQIALKLLQ
ncbi:MAG: flagellin FliC [Oligoflexia bacterium]|nr:flagellin FliC [Oligoflexia bacterium]